MGLPALWRSDSVLPTCDAADSDACRVYSALRPDGAALRRGILPTVGGRHSLGRPALYYCLRTILHLVRSRRSGLSARLLDTHSEGGRRGEARIRRCAGRRLVRGAERTTRKISN